MKILIDSDALFALYVASDIHHQKALEILQKLLVQNVELLTTSVVVQETATVISFRLGQTQAKDFLIRLNKIDIKQLFLGEKLAARAWRVFNDQNKKGTSFVDCANVAFCREMGISRVFSFDKIYRRFNLQLLT